MSLFKFLGGLIGASKQKKASRGAESALIASYDKGIAEQTRQYDQTRADFEPARRLLDPSVRSLADLVGINGTDAQQAGMDGVQNSPLLASIIRNGEEAVLQNASATGGIRGGDTQRGLADFRSDTFATELQNQMSRLASLAGMGMGATDSVATFGANKANNLTSLYGQQGGARASGLLQRGGITAAMFNNAGAFADKVVNSFAPGGGGIASLFKGF